MSASAQPDDSSGPSDPTDLTGRSWLNVVRRAVRGFMADHCTDLAASLTYYSVLALIPSAIALLSLVGLIGERERTVEVVLDIMNDVGADSVADAIRPALESIAASPSAGLALWVSLAAALWAASGYVSAFGRAMNRIYGVEEGRPLWKLRPMMLVVTVVVTLLSAATLMGLILSGPIARAVGGSIGMGSVAIQVWQIAKWPALLVFVVAIVAILYYATPNIRPPRFRWLSLGALVAILVWLVASGAFGIYVANFSSYNRTYGSMAGVVIALLWLWITNLALMFGGELDAEMERARELQAGLPAERRLQLPLRDDDGIEKAERQRNRTIRRNRRLRHSGGNTQDGSSG